MSPQGYGGRMTPEEAIEINSLFTELEATIKTKKIRKVLEHLNKFLHAMSDGVIALVNWNS